MTNAIIKPGVAVAGASSGIGAATAQLFLEAGWRVAVLARRRERLEAWARQDAAHTLAVAADLTREDEVAVAAERIRQWCGRLDALVLSAGDFQAAPMEETGAAAFEALWRVNVASKFLLTRALLPALAAPGPAPAAVVHVASLAAHRDFPDETAYTSAMHAVLGLARAQDVELRGRGIRVCAVSPGLVRTELAERHFDAATLATAMAPEAIARTIAHLVAVIRRGGYIPHVLHTA